VRRSSFPKRTLTRIAVLVAAASVGIAGTAYAVQTVAAPASFTSTLVAAHSGQCLTVRSAMDLRQSACTGGREQRFEFTPSGTDAYQIRNAARKVCLEVYRARADDGMPVTTGTGCAGKDHQRFRLRAAAAEKSFMVVAAHSGKCVDVLAGSQRANAQLVQWACGDARIAGNEVWRIDAAPSALPPAEVATTGATPSSAPSTGASSSTSTGPTPDASTAPAATDDPTGTGDASARTPDNPAWGKEAPPAGAPLSRAYQLLLSDSAKGYQPRDAECSTEIHARYWVYGADGKVYPTWHPTRDASGCAFGHEHGADPRKSNLFAKTGLPAFGYVNEQLAPSDPASQRNEDHYGYKLFAENDFPVVEGDTVTNPNRPAGDVQQTCSALAMVHQGTHSPDAFASNEHEMNLNLTCAYADNGGVISTRFKALVPFGHPSSFVSPCTFGEVKNTGTASPADSVDVPRGRGDLFGDVSGRTIPDVSCVDKLEDGADMLNTTHEFWNPRFNVSEGGLKFKTDSMFYVLNPARYYDPAQPNKLAHTVDLCYSVPGLRDRGSYGSCKGIPDGVTWDSTASPFNGCGRQFFTLFGLQNSGPETWYTDVHGLRFSETPFTGAIAQSFEGDHAMVDGQAPMHINFKNYCNNMSYGSNKGDEVHAPN
jgi:hypothetical protein